MMFWEARESFGGTVLDLSGQLEKSNSVAGIRAINVMIRFVMKGQQQVCLEHLTNDITLAHQVLADLYRDRGDAENYEIHNEIGNRPLTGR
jgi:isocitrate dehydrogenase